MRSDLNYLHFSDQKHTLEHKHVYRYQSIREEGSGGREQRGEKRGTRSGWNEGERGGRKGEERMKSGRECALHSSYLSREELQEYHKTLHAKEPK